MLMDDIEGWPSLGSSGSFNPFDGLAPIEDLEVGFGASTWLFGGDLGTATNAPGSPHFELELEQDLGPGPSAAVRQVPISSARKKRKARELLGCGGKVADPNSLDLKLIADSASANPLQTESAAATQSANKTTPTSDGTAPSPKDCKRRKVCQACILCRKAHMSCDEVRPCTRCTKRGLAHLCQDAPKKGETQPKNCNACPVSIRPRPIRSAEFRLAPSPLVAAGPLASIGPLAALASASLPSLLATSASQSEPASSARSTHPLTPAISTDDLLKPSASLEAAPELAPPAAVPPKREDSITASAASAPLPATLFSLAPHSSTVAPPRPAQSASVTDSYTPSGQSIPFLPPAVLRAMEAQHVMPTPTPDIQPQPVVASPSPKSPFTSQQPAPAPPMQSQVQNFTPAITDALAEQYMNLQNLPCGPTFPILPPSLLSTTQQLFASKAVGLEYAAIADLWSAALGKDDAGCEGGAGNGRCNTCPYNSLEQFFLTAAGETNTDASLGDRLQEVIRSKWRAGLLRPYNYGQGYARLAKYLEGNLTSLGRQRILSVIAVFQTGFAQLARNLTDMDLAAVEEQFEKLCLEYDWVFSAQGIPAALWRRTGEIYRANPAFANMVGLPLELFSEGKVCIYELMTEDSGVSYWERYGQVAFDPDQKASMSLCTLRNPGTPEVAPIQCTYSFTVRRDGVGIPLSIVGNFLPVCPKPVRPKFEMPEWVLAGMAAAAGFDGGAAAGGGAAGAGVRPSPTMHAAHLKPPIQIMSSQQQLQQLVPSQQPILSFTSGIQQQQHALQQQHPHQHQHARQQQQHPQQQQQLHSHTPSPPTPVAGSNVPLSGYAMQAIEEFLATTSPSGMLHHDSVKAAS
ncbi:hypothetical protein HDV00_002552 [Rhizophlyctis rosea]|nr:hypothetical protein HDV00_002552 [Rhizophlyctis rosea]